MSLQQRALTEYFGRPSAQYSKAKPTEPTPNLRMAAPNEKKSIQSNKLSINPSLSSRTVVQVAVPVELSTEKENAPEYTGRYSESYSYMPVVEEATTEKKAPISKVAKSVIPIKASPSESKPRGSAESSSTPKGKNEVSSSVTTPTSKVKRSTSSTLRDPRRAMANPVTSAQKEYLTMRKPTSNVQIPDTKASPFRSDISVDLAVSCEDDSVSNEFVTLPLSEVTRHSRFNNNGTQTCAPGQAIPTRSSQSSKRLDDFNKNEAALYYHSNTTSKAHLPTAPCHRKRSRLAKTPTTVNCQRLDQDAVESLPRIHAKLTLAKLKEEAVCRGLDLKRLPRTKVELLSYLVDGSIHLRETDTWKQVEVLKARIQSEEQDKANTRRRQEIESQKALHVKAYPMIHSHPLASTMYLSINGKSRQSDCDFCGRSQLLEWTCEMCDFDICRLCFNEKNMTPEERARERQEAEQQWIRIQKQCEESQTTYKKQRDEQRHRMIKRASAKFSTAIIHPTAKNLEVNGNMLKGLTVWCSLQHYKEGEPFMEFDSTWATAKDANDRARYLFFWQNQIQEDPDDLLPDIDCEKNGLKQFRVRPDTGEYTWCVGVVPDVAFPHLPNATTERHDYQLEYN